MFPACLVFLFVLMDLDVLKMSLALISCLLLVNALPGIMSSVSKRQKPSQKVYSRQRKEAHAISFRKRFEDRITNLPSSLKAKILSRLPTKNAVMTSILSREWKRTWTSINNLDFDDCLATSREYSGDDRIRSTEDFADFVNRVLLLRDRSCLQRFRLRCTNCYKGSLVNSWIAVVLLCNVQEIDLSVSVKCPFLLPSDIFLCKTLVVLKLDMDGDVNMPPSVCLPHLKTLHLASFELSDDVSISSLLSGCPVLEELSLSRCIGKDVRVINVTAPGLTNLTLDDLPYDTKGSDGDYNYEIVLDTPALQFLHFIDFSAKGYAVTNLQHLMEAVITVGAPLEDDYNLQFMEIRPKVVTDLMNGISQVRSLVLSDESMRAIDLCRPALPLFSNLTRMELTTTYFIGWRFLPKLLENAPCLETLYLRQDVEYDFFDEDYFPTDGVPSCFLSHLKVIKIYNFEGSLDEMGMIAYILKNAKVLEKLTLYYTLVAFNLVESACLYKELLKLPRSSSICKVEVL